MSIDYTNKQQVIDLAKRMGKGMTVIKHDGRANYNITHTEREDRWKIPGVKVILHVT